MKRQLFFILFAILTIMSGYALDTKNQSLTDSLSQSLQRLNSARADREQMLNDLKALRHSLPDGHEKVVIGERLGRVYLSSNLDSALLYLKIAHKDAISSHLEEDELRLRLQLYALLPTTGVTKEAVENFNSVDYKDIPPSLRRNYWLNSMELYNTLQIPYPKGNYKNFYLNKRNEALDSLLQFYPPKSVVARYLEAHKHLFDGETNLAVATFAETLKDLGDHPELRDAAMKNICDYYAEKPGQRQTYISMLLRRCIYNLNSGIVRPEALAKLGEELIKENRGKLGRECIRLALETSDFAYTQPYSSFDRAHYAHFVNDEAASLRRTTWIWILLLMIVCASGIVTTEWQRRKLRQSADRIRKLTDELNSEVTTAQHTNQNLISLAFMAMEQSKDLHVHVMRKLKAGQVKDLYADVESGKFIQRQKEKYFTNFDSTFLATFPDFIEKLNALMLPERRIAEQASESLTPELRIAAFMKLGITDTTKLSEALGLSVNTIYTYRNRLRSRLIDKDNFESDLAAIR